MGTEVPSAAAYHFLCIIEFDASKLSKKFEECQSRNCQGEVREGYFSTNNITCPSKPNAEPDMRG